MLLLRSISSAHEMVEFENSLDNLMQDKDYSEFAAQFMEETYSFCDVPVLEDFFKMGYFLREAALQFKSLSHHKIRKTGISRKSRLILESGEPVYEKIKTLAVHKTDDGEYIGISEDPSDFSLFGLPFSYPLMVRRLKILMKKHHSILELTYRENEIIKETTFRHLALGYCFRLSEEFVSANKKGRPKTALKNS